MHFITTNTENLKIKVSIGTSVLAAESVTDYPFCHAVMKQIQVWSIRVFV
jgi:hypothetical protein